MDKMNLPFFYQIGANLDPVTSLTIAPPSGAVGDRFEMVLKCLNVRGDIIALLSTFPMLSVCRAAGQDLSIAISEVIEAYLAIPSEKRVEPDAALDGKLRQISDKAKIFKTVLNAELQTLAAYHVTEKGIYSTTSLIEQASNHIPVAIRNAVSKESKDELDQAGRCLAFDLPTASGFHTWRAVEVVLKMYCKELGAISKRRDWGSYIAALRAANADPKTIAVLDQIRELHRNPTMHPDVVLGIDEAMGLFGIAPSAIVAMVTDILKHRQSTPSPPALPSGPSSNAP